MLPASTVEDSGAVFAAGGLDQHAISPPGPLSARAARCRLCCPLCIAPACRCGAYRLPATVGAKDQRFRLVRPHHIAWPAWIRQLGVQQADRAHEEESKPWVAHGRRAEAHDIFAPVYGWFAEGFDTVDLKDARQLLDRMA